MSNFAQRLLDKKVMKNQGSNNTVSLFSKALNIKEFLICETYESALHENTAQTLCKIYWIQYQYKPALVVLAVFMIININSFMTEVPFT